jgi:hypothetical protein
MHYATLRQADARRSRRHTTAVQPPTLVRVARVHRLAALAGAGRVTDPRPFQSVLALPTTSRVKAQHSHHPPPAMPVVLAQFTTSVTVHPPPHERRMNTILLSGFSGRNPEGARPLDRPAGGEGRPAGPRRPHLPHRLLQPVVRRTTGKRVCSLREQEVRGPIAAQGRGPPYHEARANARNIA